MRRVRAASMAARCGALKIGKLVESSSDDSVRYRITCVASFSEFPMGGRDNRWDCNTNDDDTGGVSVTSNNEIRCLSKLENVPDTYQFGHLTNFRITPQRTSRFRKGVRRHNCFPNHIIHANSGYRGSIIISTGCTGG
jgi:hypothetical protein